METVIHGECIEVMRGMEPDSVDAIVTDPPYGLEFMGKDWDKLGAVVEHPDDGEGPWGRKHRIRYGASVRSMQQWHQDWAAEALRVAKPGAYLLAAGSPRTYHRLASGLEDAGWVLIDCIQHIHGQGFPKGKGQLKPGYEPWTLARKPAPRVLPLQIDACRIHSGPSEGGKISGSTALGQGSGWNAHNNRATDIDRSMASGRWPANVILDESAGRELDLMSGITSGGAHPVHSTGGKNRVVYGQFEGYERPKRKEMDSGGASRFFYCPKSSTAERTLPDGTRSNHPTMKPLSLMQYLVRLVTPHQGTVLDPFAGSGTTLLACRAEGFDCIGIEREAEYINIIHQRLAISEPTGQLSLLGAI